MKNKKEVKMDYEKMWKELKSRLEKDVSGFCDVSTNCNMDLVARVQMSKIGIQTMRAIEDCEQGRKI